MDYGYIYENYNDLKDEIAELSARAGQDVTLVCVTKSGSDEEVMALAEAGMTDLGENRPQSLCQRGELLRDRGHEPRLHEIGNLQRNKVKYIAERVALIHSLDSIELAAEINKQAERHGRRIPVLIEINSGREEAKGGIMPEEAEDFFLEVRKFAGLAVSGLMTMGPALDDAEDMRPYVRLTKEIFEKIKNRYGFEGDGILSMGMSDSYAVAIEEGATLVRVGRKLFYKGKGE